MKKLILFLIVITLTQCSSDLPTSTESLEENSSSVQSISSYTCEDVQGALNKVYLAYSEVEAGSLPSPATLDSFLDWPLLFNEKLKENLAYKDIISSVTKFDELINAKPDCLGELE